MDLEYTGEITYLCLHVSTWWSLKMDWMKMLGLKDVLTVLFPMFPPWSWPRCVSRMEERLDGKMIRDQWQVGRFQFEAFESNQAALE